MDLIARSLLHPVVVEEVPLGVIGAGVLRIPHRDHAGWDLGAWGERLQSRLDIRVVGGGETVFQGLAGGVQVAGGLIGVGQGEVGLRAFGIDLDGGGEGQDGLLVIALSQILLAQVIPLLPGGGFFAAGGERERQDQGQKEGHSPFHLSHPP